MRSSSPPIQSEISFASVGSDCMREWLREHRKTRLHRLGDLLSIHLLLPMVNGLLALIESTESLRIIPAPVWMISSMLISITVYSSRMGWKLAVGFIILLMIHECGHLLAARYYGARMSVPIFIPYIGAIIDMKQPMRNAWEEAVFGISGPVLGSLGAFACLTIHHITGSFLFAELAFFGLFLNLFNLIPLGFLDGGHVSVALTRWLWVPGYLMMAAFVWFIHSPAAIMALIVMMPMVLALFRGKPRKERDSHPGDYDRVSVAKRIFMGSLYVGLLAILIAAVGLVWCKDIAPEFHSGQRLFPRTTTCNLPVTGTK